MKNLFKSIIIKISKQLLGSYKGTIIYCPYCGSAETEYYDLIHEDKGCFKTDNYKIKCKSCGAKGLVKEVWTN
jgi:DNA-directed RNA polymerase subunit RPC12/RpoP